jgi:aspartate/methionine/tyrosine aminotransferase
MSSGDSYCETGPKNFNHQYSKPGEEMLLSQVLTKKYSEKFDIPLTASNICTTVGAQEGIFTALSTFCNLGDEIVVITPSFDAYFKTAAFLGLKVSTVQLQGPKSQRNVQANDYRLDYSELRATLTNETKFLILNTPSAPLGKVYSREELECIAQVVKDFPNLIILSDEVYECMVYDNLSHTHMAAIRDMFEKTITLFSAGKTFSCTGWRLGYAIGPSSLMIPFKTVHSVINFSTTTLFQKACSLVFQEADETGYYPWLQTLLQQKRDSFCSILKELDVEYILPNGGYFVMANMRKFYHLAEISDAEVAAMTPDTPLHERPDVKFSRWLTTQVGVCPIPMSPFYVPNQREAANNWIRFAYCKDDQTLRVAGERLLAKLKNTRCL